MRKRNDMKRAWVAAGMLGAAAVGARLVAFTQESFFTDEVVTGRVIAGDVWQGVLAMETSPPLYFYLAKAWLALAGGGLGGIRLLSVLTGAMVAPLAWWAAGRMGMSRTACWLAGAMAVLAPMLVWYGQQARAFAMEATVATAWLGLTAACVTAPAGWRRAASAAGVAAALFAGFSLHYTFAFPVGGGVAALAVMAAMRRGRGEGWVACLAAHGTAMAAWLVYLPLFRAQAAAGRYQWIARPDAAELGRAFTDGMIGGPFHHLAGWTLWATLGLYALALAALVAIAARRVRPEAERGTPAWGILLAGVVAGGTLLPWAISQGERVVFLRDRYTIAALPALLLGVAWAMDGVPWKSARRAGLALAAVLFISVAGRLTWETLTPMQELDWKGTARLVRQEWRVGDAMMGRPGGLGEAYAANGGDRWAPVTEQSKRVWVVAWLGMPEGEEKEEWDKYRASEGARARIEFAHVQLWEVGLSRR